MNIKTNIIYNLVVVALNVPVSWIHVVNLCSVEMLSKDQKFSLAGALQSYILQQHNIY